MKPAENSTVQVGKYFNLREFTDSETAARNGIPNDPDAAAFEALRLLCARVLDPLREALGKPITITSGFRSERVNQLAGGARTSQHKVGEAADFKVSGMTPAQVFDFIRASQLDVDQCILEFGQWVHVSYSSRQTRNQFLIARKVNGATKYDHVERRPKAQQVPIPPVPPTQAAPTVTRATAAPNSASVPVAPPVVSVPFVQDANPKPSPSAVTTTWAGYADIKQEQFAEPIAPPTTLDRIKQAMGGLSVSRVIGILSTIATVMSFGAGVLGDFDPVLALKISSIAGTIAGFCGRIQGAPKGQGK